MAEAAGTGGQDRRRAVHVGLRGLRWTVIAVALVCFLWCSGVFDFFRQYLSWEQLGSIQVLDGGTEAWLFIEIDRRFLIQNRYASAPNRAIGHFQEVVVIDEAGVKSRTRVARENGVSFHPNTSTLFHHGALYLYEDWSMGTHRSLFDGTRINSFCCRWKNQRRCCVSLGCLRRLHASPVCCFRTASGSEFPNRDRSIWTGPSRGTV